MVTANGRSGSVQRTAATVIRVGLAEDNDWRASDVSLERQGARFYVEAPKPQNLRAATESIFLAGIRS